MVKRLLRGLRCLFLPGAVIASTLSQATEISFDLELHQESDETTGKTTYFTLPTLHCSPYASYYSGEPTYLILAGLGKTSLNPGESDSNAGEYGGFDTFAALLEALTDTSSAGLSELEIPGKYQEDGTIINRGTTEFNFAVRSNGFGFGAVPVKIASSLQGDVQSSRPTFTWTGPTGIYSSISVSVYNLDTYDHQQADLVYCTAISVTSAAFGKAAGT